MLRLIVALSLFISTTALSASEPVTVQQLEQIIAHLSSKNDKDASHRLAECKLTERLTTARLNMLQDSLPGERSRLTLLAIADASAFLASPPTEFDSRVAPDKNVQKQILVRAVSFVGTTTAKMPDFLADRTVLRFQDTKFATYDNEPVVVTPDLYYLVEKRSTTVRYRNGQEEEAGPSTRYEKPLTRNPIPEMITQGIFGPMLQTVMQDILKSRIGWSRWERLPSGPIAVFRYSVPKDRATFTVSWCCSTEGPGAGIQREIHTVTAYHGEIFVEPETGAVLRITMIADLDQIHPVSTADVFVEYAPVDIGERRYICPTRSGTLLVARSIILHDLQIKSGEAYWVGTEEKLNVTSISDTRFDHYHVFGSEMKILQPLTDLLGN